MAQQTNQCKEESWVTGQIIASYATHSHIVSIKIILRTYRMCFYFIFLFSPFYEWIETPNHWVSSLILIFNSTLVSMLESMDVNSLNALFSFSTPCFWILSHDQGQHTVLFFVFFLFFIYGIKHNCNVIKYMCIYGLCRSYTHTRECAKHKFFYWNRKFFFIFVFIFFYVMLSEYVTSKTAIQDERRWITKKNK